MNFNDIIDSIWCERERYTYLNKKEPENIFMTKALHYFLRGNDSLLIRSTEVGVETMWSMTVHDIYSDDPTGFEYYFSGDKGMFREFDKNHPDDVLILGQEKYYRLHPEMAELYNYKFKEE